MRDMRNVYKVSVGICRHRLKSHIKMSLQWRGCEVVEWLRTGTSGGLL